MIREERNALLLLVAFTGAASLLYLLVLRPALRDVTRPIAPRPEVEAAARTDEGRPPVDARPKSARRMLGLEALLVDAVTGRPRSDATVTVTRVDDIAEPTASLGADGALRVDHLPPDITFGVEIECDGYEPRSFPRLRGEAREVLSLGVVALEPRRRVRVAVRDEDESPVDRARVSIRPRDDVAPSDDARARAARVAEALLLPAVATAATDSDGVATLRDLPPRHALVSISSGERPTVVHEVDVFAGDVTEPVTLGPGVPFRGRAVDPGGTAIPGARVILVEAREGPGPGLSVAVTDADDDGRFTAPRVAPVPHHVFVIAPARAAVALGPFPPGGREDVVVAVPDGAAIEGTLRSRTGR
ncbi:MAG: carboxypeptidase-like regulatory domain-containing protein, partial [Planctomycetota bacterium JB042]